MNAISNTKSSTPRDETINGKTRTVVEFLETPKMSAYLLAFIVSNYKGSFNADKSFGVYSRPEAENRTKLALEFGQESLKKLGEYVGIDYYSIDKIDKLDMAVSKKCPKID